MKTLLTIIATLSLFTIASAQETDSLQLKSINPNSIEIKLNKLQCDYEFLNCKCALESTQFRLDLLKLELKNATNNLVLWRLNKVLDADIYANSKNAYDSFVNMYNSLKIEFELAKNIVPGLISVYDFSKTEIDVLEGLSKELGNRVSTIEHYLNLYKTTLDQYKNAI